MNPPPSIEPPIPCKSPLESAKSNESFAVLELGSYLVVLVVRVMQKAEMPKTESLSPVSFGSFCKILTTHTTLCEPDFTNEILLRRIAFLLFQI